MTVDETRPLDSEGVASADLADPASTETAAPLAFTVSKGALTPEETAALTVVLAAASAAGGGDGGSATSRPVGWRNRRRMMPAWAGRYGWGNR